MFSRAETPPHQSGEGTCWNGGKTSRVQKVRSYALTNQIVVRHEPFLPFYPLTASDWLIISVRGRASWFEGVDWPETRFGHKEPVLTAWRARTSLGQGTNQGERMRETRGRALGTPGSLLLAWLVDAGRAGGSAGDPWATFITVSIFVTAMRSWAMRPYIIIPTMRPHVSYSYRSL